MIQLKEGQKVLGEDGSLYEIEKGDVLTESKKLKEANIDNATRKIFIEYVEEIIENVIDLQPGFNFDSKGIWAIVRVLGTMALPEDNPNYKNILKYLPKKFNKVLFDNGGGNTYDSAWMSIRDEQQFKIVNQAAKNLGLI